MPPKGSGKAKRKQQTAAARAASLKNKSVELNDSGPLDDALESSSFDASADQISKGRAAAKEADHKRKREGDDGYNEDKRAVLYVCLQVWIYE